MWTTNYHFHPLKIPLSFTKLLCFVLFTNNSTFSYTILQLVQWITISKANLNPLVMIYDHIQSLKLRFCLNSHLEVHKIKDTSVFQFQVSLWRKLKHKKQFSRNYLLLLHFCQIMWLMPCRLKLLSVLYSLHSIVVLLHLFNQQAQDRFGLYILLLL